MTNDINNPTCSDFAHYVDQIAGPAYRVHQPVVTALFKRLTHLKPAVNDAIKAGDYPWPQFGENAAVNPVQFVIAATNLFPDEVYAATRLPAIRPPDNIHRMQRSNPYWVGDFFSANLIIQGLQHCELEMDDLSLLDIGCSSGSLLRVLGAYNHSWTLYGCDPVRSSIAWAQDNIKTATFKYMDNKPPLDFEDDALDGITSISVWSHHRPDAAKVWIDEVARILKPGGFFAVTFSTLHHIRWRAKQKDAIYTVLETMFESVAETGNHFVPFNYAAEDNETDTDWGQSVYSRERFLSMFFETFTLAGFFPGANQGNQDLAIFVKR